MTENRERGAAQSRWEQRVQHSAQRVIGVQLRAQAQQSANVQVCVCSVVCLCIYSRYSFIHLCFDLQLVGTAYQDQERHHNAIFVQVDIMEPHAQNVQRVRRGPRVTMGLWEQAVAMGL